MTVARPPNQGFLPALLILSLISSAIELEISAPGLLLMMQDWAISDEMACLTINVNLLGLALTSLLWGPCSEYLGRRSTMLLGYAVLVSGAYLAYFSPDIHTLLVARFLQGCGAAAPAVLIPIIIADCYSQSTSVLIYGLMNAFFTLCMALSPILGGQLALSFGWQSVFGILAGTSSTAYLTLYLLLPETQSGKRMRFNETWQHYGQMMQNRRFLAAATAPSLLYSCYLLFISTSSFIYAQELHLDLAVFTYHQGSVIATFAITSLFCGPLSQLIGNPLTLIIGMLSCLLGTGLGLIIHEPWLLTSLMCCFSFGFALIYPIVFAFSMEIFSDSKGPAASLIMSLRYFIATALMLPVQWSGDVSQTFVGSLMFVSTLVILTLITGLLRQKHLR